MPANSNHIPGTTVLSSLSLLGTFSASTISGAFSSDAAATLGSTLSVAGAVTATTSVKIGATGTPVTRLSVSTVAIVAMTLLANRSQTTTFTLSGATPGDLVLLNPNSSGYSNGVTAQPYVNAVDTVTVNFSNVSGATAVQIAGNYIVGLIRS